MGPVLFDVTSLRVVGPLGHHHDFQDSSGLMHLLYQTLRPLEQDLAGSELRWCNPCMSLPGGAPHTASLIHAFKEGVEIPARLELEANVLLPVMPPM